MKNIILFGHQGAGKSSVARIIKKLYGNEIYSLGSYIHKECRKFGNETREQMQNYGQAMRRIFGEDIWCDYLMKMVEGEFAHNNTIIIDDARQINEYDYFLKLDFIPIAVVADENVRFKRLKKRVNYEVHKNTEKHETEIQAEENIQRCKIKIYNNGNLIQLKREVKDTLEYIEK